MNNFRVPPSPTWYIPPVCSPDNGLLYIAGNHTSITYIPPVQSENSTKSNAAADTQNVQNIQTIQTHNHFKALDCDPNWSQSKWFVTMNEQNFIWVWDLETGKVCRGHKAHVADGVDRRVNSDSYIGGTMCISKNRQVLSIDQHAFVRYCLVSNTYSLFPDNFVTKRGTVTTLKTSPYNPDIIAIGYKNGLIVIVNYAENITLQRLRGHDSDVVSLQWTLFKGKSQEKFKTNESNFETPEKRYIKKNDATPSTSTSKSKYNKRKPEPKQKNREPPKPIVDAGDMFDIHSYDYLEEEFGTISSKISSKTDAVDDEKKLASPNENFNFVEECQTLRDKIRTTEIDSDSDGSYGYNMTKDQSAVNMSDIQKFMANKGPNKNDSIELSDDADEPTGIDEISNLSTIGSSHNATEIVELEEVLKDMNINDDDNGTIYLVSGAQESSVIVWNIETGDISDIIELKSEKGRPKIPKTNCTIGFIAPNVFIVNGPDGKLSTWKTTEDSTDTKLKFTLDRQDFADTAVINVCSNFEYKPVKTTLWTISIHLNIVGHSFAGMESSEIVAQYATLPIGMFSLSICPHDPNKIAIAGNNKRINIFDLSTLKHNNIEIHTLTSRIHGKIIGLSWHPTDENLLSFSTIEGRVGTFNLSKGSSLPELMKNFCGRDLYGMSYGIDVDQEKYTLFVTNQNSLMMFNENSSKDEKHKALTFKNTVSSVSTFDIYIAVGFSTGLLKIILNDKKEMFSETIAKKYLSALSWSTTDPTKLAASSNDSMIYIFKKDDKKFKKIGELTGHEAGVTFITWSGQSKHKLVSSSFDHTVRVWDTEKFECIAWYEYENTMNCTTFLPTDENFVVASGLSETMHIFEIGKRLVTNVGHFQSKKKKKPFNNDVKWAHKYQNEASKLQSQEKKKLRQLEKKTSEMIVQITDQLNSVELNPLTPSTSSAPSTSTEKLKLSHTTILYLTNKEINKKPLDQLQNLLKKSSTSGDSGSKESLHSKLFGDRSDVIKLLNEELKNHRCSKTDSIGTLLIPQIHYDLKANILENIEGKTLTEQHLSVAPHISYEFWKNCSLAFANQCVEKGFVLQAVPHLLAIQQVSEAIEKLCDAHFYREAWCIAKLHKESEDKIFEVISTKWIEDLELKGNLEGAALIAFLVEKRELAFNILSKRKSKTEQIEDILKSLSPIESDASD